MGDHGCSHYPSADKCVGITTAQPFALSVSPPPFPSLPYQRGERRWKVRADAERGSERLPTSEGCMERDVNQIQHRQVPQTASSTGPSSRLSSRACFLKVPSNASLHWNEEPLHPRLAQQAIKIKEPNTPLSCCWWTWVEGEAFPYTPLPSFIHPTLSLPPTLPHHPNTACSFSVSSQRLCCLLLIPSFYSLSRIHSVSTRSYHPSPFLSIFPPHISVGALLCPREGHVATGSYLGMYAAHL